jgi:hypothetical protein
MTRLERFQSALDHCARLLKQYPNSRALESIMEQLRYLIGVESGSVSDRSRLRAINIGVLAAREVEDMDNKVAEALHSVAAEVRQM